MPTNTETNILKARGALPCCGCHAAAGSLLSCGRVPARGAQSGVGQSGLGQSGLEQSGLGQSGFGQVWAPLGALLLPVPVAATRALVLRRSSSGTYLPALIFRRSSSGTYLPAIRARARAPGNDPPSQRGEPPHLRHDRQCGRDFAPPPPSAAAFPRRLFQLRAFNSGGAPAGGAGATTSPAFENVIEFVRIPANPSEWARTRASNPSIEPEHRTRASNPSEL